MRAGHGQAAAPGPPPHEGGGPGPGPGQGDREMTLARVAYLGTVKGSRDVLPGLIGGTGESCSGSPP